MKVLSPEPAVTPPTPATSRGRLLLISSHFPPARTAGSLRWQKMAQFIHERGWDLDVVTLDPACLAEQDPSRLAELPPGTRIFPVPARELALDTVVDRTWKALGRVRRRMHRAPAAAAAALTTTASAPVATAAESRSIEREALHWRPRGARDLARAFHAWRWHAGELAWAERAAEAAEAMIDPALHRAVITSGPPHGTHLAGRRVARRHGLPHVVDMRDPWSQVEQLLEHIASPLYFDIARRREQSVVRDAALVVANTELARRSLVAAHPGAANRSLVVMNGYDEEPVHYRRTERFTILYAGSIYLDRDPSTLFRAAASVVEEFDLSPDEFGLDFYGHAASYDGVSLPELAARAGIGSHVHVRPGVPRRELLELLAGASMLVSLPQGNVSAIPSKVFEYMPYHAWLLALADSGSATAQMLRDTRADVVDPDDLPALSATLRRRFLEHRAGVVPQPVAEERFSRRAQTETLLDALDRVLGR
jgi:glycosyltransferase involved in cell wall biosynthesis